MIPRILMSLGILFFGFFMLPAHAANKDKEERTGFVLCNKNFHELRISVISFSDGRSIHERFLKVWNGDCVEHNNSGGMIVFINMQVRDKGKDNWKMHPGSGVHKKPSAYPYRGIKGESELYRYDSLFCSNVGNVGKRSTRYLEAHRV